MGAVRPLAKSAVSGAFPGKQTVKDAGTLENMGFPTHGLIPVYHDTYLPKSPNTLYFPLLYTILFGRDLQLAVSYKTR